MLDLGLEAALGFDFCEWCVKRMYCQPLLERERFGSTSINIRSCSHDYHDLPSHVRHRQTKREARTHTLAGLSPSSSSPDTAGLFFVYSAMSSFHCSMAFSYVSLYFCKCQSRNQRMRKKYDSPNPCDSQYPAADSKAYSSVAVPAGQHPQVPSTSHRASWPFPVWQIASIFG